MDKKQQTQTEIEENPFKHKKILGSLRVIKQLNRLLREMVNCPSSEIFKL